MPIYHRDISSTILKGSALLFAFDGIVAVSTYDVFFGAFGKAAREQLPSLYVLVQLTSGITFFFGAMIGLRWVSYCLGAVRDVYVLPTTLSPNGKMALRVRAHNVLGFPARPQVFTFDDFSVGDFSSLGKPDDPFFTLPVKGNKMLVLYANAFTNPTGKALVEAAGRANRIEFSKRFNMLF